MSDTPTPLPPVVHQPPAVADPIDPTHGAPPQGWTAGQWGRLRESQIERDALRARVKDLEAAAAKVPALESEVRSWQHRHAAEVAMLGSDRPALRDAEVRAFVLERYDAAHKDVAPDKRPAFSVWFEAQCATPGALLKPYLAKPDAPPATPPAAPPPGTPPAPPTPLPTPAPHVDGGVVDTPAARSREEAIARAWREGTYSGQTADDDLAAAIAAGEVKAPKGWKPRA